MTTGHWKSHETRARSLYAGRLNLDKARSSRWRGKLSVPKNVHPIVRRIFELMNEQLATHHEVGARAGLSRQTVSNWRYRSSPSLQDVTAVLNSLGYDLRVTKLRTELDGKPGPKPHPAEQREAA